MFYQHSVQQYSGRFTLLGKFMCICVFCCEFIQSHITLRVFTYFTTCFSSWHTGNALVDAKFVSIFRYFNSRITDHFYTANWGELGCGKNGWRVQGVTCIMHSRKVHGTVPIYRYWNGKDHLYTTNRQEIGVTHPGHVGHHGYRSEGILGYCYPKWVPGTVPLYRYYKLHGQDHFYTTNIHEIGTRVPGVVGKYGYKFERVACYVFK